MRKPNQDNYIIKKNVTGIENAWLLSVCDGHGDHGHFVSEFIKKVFPQVLQNLSRGLNPTENLNLKGLGQQRPAQIGKTLKKSPEQQEEEPTQLQKPLYDVFTMPAEQRDQLITLAYKALQEKMVISGKHDSVMSGSTFVSVFCWNDRIVCANSGDSRAILCEKKDGKWRVIALSRDHKPDDPDELARIRKKGGKVEQSRLLPGMCPPRQVGMLVGPARVWLKNKPLPGLAMSRSIGDMVVKPVGVTEEPEITVHGSQTAEKEFVGEPKGH